MQDKQLDMNTELANIPARTIDEFLRWSERQIATQEGLCFQSPKLEARLLFSHISHKSHSWIMTYGASLVSEKLSEAQIQAYLNCLKQRLMGQPIAFILGTQEFWTLTLKVSDCTLIPRQDTESLVEAALDLPLNNTANVLDLGTGTGAVALSLAKEKPDWQVLGLDKIEAAVELARENARLNNVDVAFLRSNWFSALDCAKLEHNFDLIVSNPPYVEADSDYLKHGDLRFEPLSALVSGKDGLDDIRKIITQSIAFLNNKAFLAIEHGQGQANAVQSLFRDAGFSSVQSKRDINEIERITMGQWRA